MAAGRAVLISSGVNLSRFTPAPEAAGPPVVLMASRLLWVKGVREFVAAAQALHARGCGARFVLVGDPDRGHPSAVPERELERWRAAGHIEWRGWEDCMPLLLRRSHVVCLPSYYGEGVPRILLEAAAAGRAIVASDIPGCREIVRDGENGLVVPPRDVDALGAAIGRLVENTSLRIEMGARGRCIAESEFSERQVVDATLATYRSLLAPISVSCTSL